MPDENPYSSPQVERFQQPSPRLTASEKRKQLFVLSWLLCGIFIVFLASFWFPLVTEHPDPTKAYAQNSISPEQRLRIAQQLLTFPCLLFCFALLRFGNRYVSVIVTPISIYGFWDVLNAPNRIEIPLTRELGFYFWISTYALLIPLSIVVSIQRFRYRS